MVLAMASVLLPITILDEDFVVEVEYYPNGDQRGPYDWEITSIANDPRIAAEAALEHGITTPGRILDLPDWLRAIIMSKYFDEIENLIQDEEQEARFNQEG